MLSPLLIWCVTVHCRTGSLESQDLVLHETYHVQCRTGSLESTDVFNVGAVPVHCRTGSLENESPIFVYPIRFTAAQAA